MDLIDQYLRIRRDFVDDALRCELGNRAVDALVKHITPAGMSSHATLHRKEVTAATPWPETADTFDDE